MEVMPMEGTNATERRAHERYASRFLSTAAASGWFGRLC